MCARFRILTLIATISIWTPLAVMAYDLHGAPCFEACQMTLRQVRFSDIDAGANRRIQACESRFALTSLYVCASVFCTIEERTAGLDAHNSTCLDTVGSSLPSFDKIVANYTKKDISRIPRLSSDDYRVPRNFGEPVIPSQKFFILAYGTLASWSYVYSRHIAYGAAMFVFWTTVVVIGLFSRIIVALGYRSTAQQQEWQSVPLSEPENLDFTAGNKNARSRRSYALLKRFVTIPATFGYRNAQPFGWYTVPPRIQSLTILSFIIVNIVFCIHGYHVFPGNLYFPKVFTQAWRYLSDRTGIISFANFPLIWLFGMRNNLLMWLTGWDFGTYNNFHRWVARVSTFQAVVHSVGYTILVFDDGGWDLFADYWAQMWWTTGEIATILMCLLLGLSIYFLRRTRYELFLILHIVLSVLILAGMIGHVSIFKKGQYNNIVWVCCVIWAFDRVLRGLRILAFNPVFGNTIANARYDRGADIVRLSIPFSTSLYRPKPGTFYYLYWFNEFRVWESHPFTVASVRVSSSSEVLQGASQRPDFVEESTSLLPPEEVNQMGSYEGRKSSLSASTITFLIRPYDGFTRRLRDAASIAMPHSAKFRVFVEGPYGHTQPFHRFENILFIVGGTGIVVPLSYLEALCKSLSRTKSIRIIWAVREAAFAATVLREDFHGLLENSNLSVEVYLTKSDSVSQLAKEIKEVQFFHGRPHVHGEVEDAVRDFQDQGSLAVVACGPAKMADDTRKAVVDMLGRGLQPIEYFEERFHW
ncbi:ferric reductase like transmembrane component-domain-containing protein [Xylogone sp. PMI_703]|nr:ferric reductase like transmembrane component-domain-containing protein [Xylogone sp. PMI_703]